MALAAAIDYNRCRSCGARYAGPLCNSCHRWAGEAVAQAIYFELKGPVEFHLSTEQKAEQAARRILR